MSLLSFCERFTEPLNTLCQFVNIATDDRQGDLKIGAFRVLAHLTSVTEERYPVG